jgi:formylglycine-generating enzyme required for sulfatase activity
MLGNLREWTSTRLGPYPYRADDGREAFDGETERVVVRGAAAGHHHVGVRCAKSEDLGEIGPGGR